MSKPLPDGPIDTLGLREAILSMPEQLEAAGEVGPVDGVPPATAIDHVVLVGTGAGGLAGEMVRTLAAPVSQVPVLVHHDHRLPAHVSVRSLCIVSSFDGDSADMANAVTAAHRAGSRLVVVSGPGRLVELTAELGVPHVPVATDVTFARAALPALVVPALAVLEQLGSFSELTESVTAAVAQLRTRRSQVGAADPDPDPARLARRIGRTLPIIYGAGDLGVVAARRWKSQVNENAKAAAFSGGVPEVTHDEIAGWGQHGDMTRQVFSLVTLRHDHEDPGSDARFAVIEELVEEVVADRHRVDADGDGPLAQLFDLCFQGDLMSYHLAQENEIDPGPVAAVEAVAARVRAAGVGAEGR